MSQNDIVEIHLEGRVATKKNSRARTAAGDSIPSKDYQDWHKVAMQQVRLQTRQRIYGHVMIEAIIYFGTLGRADTDNKITSILDMLVDAMVLPDDYWESVAKTSYEAAYRPGNPGAFVRITKLPPDFFGQEYLEAAAKRDKRKRAKLR